MRRGTACRERTPRRGPHRTGRFGGRLTNRAHPDLRDRDLPRRGGRQAVGSPPATTAGLGRQRPDDGRVRHARRRPPSPPHPIRRPSAPSPADGASSRWASPTRSAAMAPRARFPRAMPRSSSETSGTRCDAGLKWIPWMRARAPRTRACLSSPSSRNGSPASASAHRRVMWTDRRPVLGSWPGRSIRRGARHPCRSQPARAGAAASIQVPIFIGADQPVTGDRRWEPGRYVFAVEAPAAAYERWFGVEIRSPPGKLSD